MPKVKKFDPNSNEEYDLSGDDSIFEKMMKYIGLRKKKPAKRTLASVRKKQGPGFWQADIGDD